MTLPPFRVAPWTLTLAVVVLAAVPSGTATAQFFDPFSQFFAPQAPAYAPQYAPQAPVYSPPVVSRRGPRDSRRPRAERVRVPERAPVRAARDPVPRAPRPRADPRPPCEPARPSPQAPGERSCFSPGEGAG